jgi:hypothetical protein
MPIDNLFTKMSIRLINTRPAPLKYYWRMTCLWGLFLLLPFSTFATAASFSVMQRYAPEWLWGALIFGIGYNLKFAALSKKTKRIRDALFGTSVIWIFITFMLVLGNPFGTGVIVYPLFTYYVARAYLIYATRYAYLKQEIEETIDVSA